MSRETASSSRLKQCWEQLRGYPDWDDHLSAEARSFAADLTDNQRRARLMGKELDAALQDPRWWALVAIGNDTATP
jgi:hypothetical protein